MSGDQAGKEIAASRNNLFKLSTCLNKVIVPLLLSIECDLATVSLFGRSDYFQVFFVGLTPLALSTKPLSPLLHFLRSLALVEQPSTIGGTDATRSTRHCTSRGSPRASLRLEILCTSRTLAGHFAQVDIPVVSQRAFATWKRQSYRECKQSV